ncbi:MAG: transcription elongation factor GreB [Ottowia sp.]|nr:transcription elongation factor GreB [Ottowia sp.]
MSKAFVREGSSAPAQRPASRATLPAGAPNYITAAGSKRLLAELHTLIHDERPKVVDAVHWAAKNGDRSENGDYIYGKKRLREIDRRIRFLTRQLEIASVVDPSVHHGKEQIFFGATVTYLVDGEEERRVTIKGVDEADATAGEISWVSPLARALLRARVGDECTLRTPGGERRLEVLDVEYPAPDGSENV